MHNFQGSSKSRSDEEPSTKRQRLLCRTKKIELSEDEVNSSQLLLQQHQTLPTTSSGKFSTVSVSNVSNIDLRNMVTNSLPLETKSPQVNMLQNNESQLFSPGMRRNSNSQISFSTVEIFYFERAQGFSTIPSHGDIALGMGEKHYLQQNFSLSDFNSSQAKRKQSSPRRNPPRGPSKFRIQAEKKSTQNSQESIENCQLETINEMEEPTEAVSVTPFITTSMDDEPRVENEKKPANKNVDDNSSSSSESEVEDECCEEDEVFHDVNLLQPLSNKNRKLLLKEAGVRINQNEKFECRNIRRSRLTCGCSCEDGICLPETCECAQEDISCQVDRPSFPCSCTASSCENPVGRMEFDSSNVRSHFMQTVKRIKASESANLESPTKCSPRNSLIETERCAPSCFSTPQLTPYLKTLDRWSLHSSIGSRNLKSPGTPNSDIIVEDILAASKPLDQTLEDSPIKSSVFAPCPSLLGPSKTRSKISVLMAARSISFTSSMDRAD